MHFGNSAKETNKWMTISSIRSVDRFEISNIFQDSVNSNTKLLISQSFQVWCFSCYESIPFWSLLRCQYLEGSVETVQSRLQTSSNNSVCHASLSPFVLDAFFGTWTRHLSWSVPSDEKQQHGIHAPLRRGRYWEIHPQPKRLQSVFSWGDISQYLLRLGEEQVHSLITQASVRRDTRKRRSLQG